MIKFYMRIEIKTSFVKDLKTVPKDFREKIAGIIGTMEQASNLSDLILLCQIS